MATLLLLLVVAPLMLDAQQTPVLGQGNSASCYNKYGKPQRCIPEFQNAAYGVQMKSSNTCGENGDTVYCIQTGTSTNPCDICSQNQFEPYFMTDLHHERENITWWQSETMNEGVQYPNQVNLILNLGKAFDITYVRIVFYSPRPESFAIYKRTKEDGEWEPYQYYSASCRETYKLPDTKFIEKGVETRALCTGEYSDISPLRGGNIAFSTLEGRPSAVYFDNSTELQEWVTATDIKITLDRLNTFGDEVFGGAQVLQSYWYAIADIAVGARCKCNGHASKCEDDYVNGVRERRCICEHFTAGKDCERCMDFYNDAPWGRASSGRNVHECKPCNCNGYSSVCYFDKELYDRTGHGGHCINCTNNRDGPNCERCRENYYMRRDGICVPCYCDAIGSRSLQCNSEGKCQCKSGVTGERCEQCAPNHYQFNNQGCKPCHCHQAGSLGNEPMCDADTGVCSCKDNVEGTRCQDCRPGFFNLDLDNDFGCTPCFCYGHSVECQSAPGYSKIFLESNFARNNERWWAQDSQKKTIGIKYNESGGNIAVTTPSRENIYFSAPSQFLGNQIASYNHDLKFVLSINESISYFSKSDLILESSNARIEIPITAQGNPSPSTEKREYTFRLHENQAYEWSPTLNAGQYMAILSNLTSIRIRATYSPRSTGILDNFKMETANRGSAGSTALWVELCKCPTGFVGQFCESCAAGYRHTPALGGPFKPCIPCDCNKHAQICDSESGRCICKHNTAGANCELCAKGYYGNALLGTPNDCKECPCPEKSACIQMGDDNIICTDCPKGYAGSRCEGCSDGYFGDPTGTLGPVTKCKLCECNMNIDTNAVANCNQTTGECLKCIYNTDGPNCERCLPGYYGDALAPTKGDCKQCECYRMGTYTDETGITQCDSLSGQCFCKSHVLGRNCDTCEAGYYNINSGEGCQSCNCSFEGSYNSTCDPYTGACHCRPGVTGLQCNQCKPNYYGFSNKGCKECNCDPIGSKALQCNTDGQCPCYDNVEGLQCDTCKENKYDRQKNCIDCPACYNLVKEAVDKHRLKVANLDKQLQDIEKSPTIIHDSDFDENLNDIRKKIESLLESAKSITGNEGITLIGKINEFNAKLDEISNHLNKITTEADVAAKSANFSVAMTASVTEKVDNSGKEVDNAMEFLQNDGSIALSKAQARSDQFGQQSNQMSSIAQESRMITEKLEKEATNIKNIADHANKAANDAYKLAKNGFNQQASISNELRLLESNVKAASEKAENVGTKVEESLKKANDAHEKSFKMYAEVEKLSMPTVDIKKILEDADDISGESSTLNDKINKINNENEKLFEDLKDQIQTSQILLNKSHEHQGEIQDLLAELDTISSKAETSVKNINMKYDEVKNINKTLKEFHNKVQTSRQEAKDALEKMPGINDIINKVSDAKESLAECEANAVAAKKRAEKAQNKYALQAMKDAAAAKEEIEKSFEDANTLHKEAQQLPVRINISEDTLIKEEMRVEKQKNQGIDMNVKVNQVQLEVKAVEEIIQKGLNEVTMIMDDLKNLPSLSESDLNSLEQRIDEAKKELQRANLGNEIKDLQQIKYEHQNWLNEYEKEIKKLTDEVANVKAIADSLPDVCFRELKLEPEA